MKKLLTIAFVAIPLVIACTEERIVRREVPAPEETPAKSTIGPEGGTVEAGDVTLEVPQGALTQPVEIKITKTSEKTPDGMSALSAIYKFEPIDLQLAKAARATWKNLPSSSESAVIAWSKGATSKYEAQQSTATEGAVSTSGIRELGFAFVAKGGEPPKVGGSCACPTHCDNPNVKGKKTCQPSSPPASVDNLTGKIGNFEVDGFEYWQWKKPDPYGDEGSELAWGYSGDGEPATGVVPTAESMACMAESLKVLNNILKNDVPPELEALRKAKKVYQFWNWNNDLTGAPATKKIAPEYDGLWLYDGARGDGGLIKWISATERDGSCRLPTREDLVIFAKACMTDFPDCGSGK